MSPRKIPRIEAGSGFVMVEICPNCGHTRCGKSCDCDCELHFYERDKETIRKLQASQEVLTKALEEIQQEAAALSKKEAELETAAGRGISVREVKLTWISSCAKKALEKVKQ